jgi:hypothetical protein
MARLSREPARLFGGLSSFVALKAMILLSVESNRFELVCGALVGDPRRLKNRAL